MINHPIHNVSEEEAYFLRFTRGDEKALHYFMTRWTKALSLYAVRIVHDDFEANSIIQDVFIKAWRQRGNISDALHLYNYLRYWLKWACYNRLRELRRHPVIPMEFCEQQLAYLLDDTDITREQDEQQTRLDVLDQSLASMPEDIKAMITLWKNGVNYKAMAQVESTSHQHMAGKLKKGLAYLKRVNDRYLKAGMAEARRPRLALTDYKVYLDGLQSKIFTLYYEDCRSLQQIAELLQLTPFQLQVQLRYIRQVIDDKPQII